MKRSKVKNKPNQKTLRFIHYTVYFVFSSHGFESSDVSMLIFKRLPSASKSLLALGFIVQGRGFSCHPKHCLPNSMHS